MVDVGEDLRRRAFRVVPLTLALAMLAVVVLAGLLPDTGVVSASSNCTYGKCPAATPFPLWAVSTAVVVVVIALILALLLLRRHRRQPPSEPAAGTAEPESPEPAAPAPEEFAEDQGPSPEGSEESKPPAGPSSGPDDVAP